VTSEGALIRKTMTHGKQLPQRLGAASAGKKVDLRLGSRIFSSCICGLFVSQVLRS
jgi:hypothetical protein